MTEKRKLQSEKLLAAAYELVAEVGVAGLRTRDIAEHAGVNLAIFHYCFESKEAFLRALYDFIIAQFRSEAERFLTAQSPVEQLKKQGEARAYFLREKPKPIQVWKGFIGEAWTNESVRAIIRDHLAEQRLRLTTLITAARKEGVEVGLPIEDPCLAASLMMALYDGLLFQWVVDPDAFPIDDYVKAVEALMGLEKEGSQ
jgi:AcrR family transcriptional regulator